MLIRRGVLVLLAGAAVTVSGGSLAVPGVAAATTVSAGAVLAAAGAWGTAIEVPGLGALNKGGGAEVVSVSCTSADNCAAGGYYRDGHHHDQGFVATERRGRWGLASGVHGLEALNKGGNARVISVSCSSAGNCAAAGDYKASSHSQGFVVSEKNGSWGRAAEVPGLNALNNGTDQPEAQVNSVSCATPGNCLAGGAYGGPYSWAFTASETNGVWGKATLVPGLNAIVTGRWAEVGPVSCLAPGNCVIAGDYENVVPGNTFNHGFVAVEQNGKLDDAINMPALKVLTKTVFTDVLSVSSGSPGHGTAGGFYQDNHGHFQAFVTQSR